MDFQTGAQHRVQVRHRHARPVIRVVPVLNDVDKPEQLDTSMAVFYGVVVKGSRNPGVLASGYAKCLFMSVPL